MTAAPQYATPGPGRPRALKISDKAGPARAQLALTIQEYLPPRPITFTQLGAEAHCNHATVSRIVSGEIRPSWAVLEPLTDAMRLYQQANDVRPFPARDDWYDLYADAAREAGKTPEPKDKPPRPDDPDHPGDPQPGDPGPGGGQGPSGIPSGSGRGPGRNGPPGAGRARTAAAHARKAAASARAKAFSRGGLHIGTFLVWLCMQSALLHFPPPAGLFGTISVLSLLYLTPRLRRFTGLLRLHVRSLALHMTAVITRNEVYRHRQLHLRKQLEHDAHQPLDSDSE
ncbi:hypothetical protein [Streptomyces sp. NPDC088766]|uniref:hypothetical protein n=1 Tax=Streptomyces sp. NPDC088766 TaxID=3365893 RepID=UPI003813BBFD